MKLLNFELDEPSFAIALRGLDSYWDLHGFWDFVGLTINAHENSASMGWRIWPGEPSGQYSQLNLIFRDLTFLSVSARDEELPLSEDSCVSSVSKVSLEPASEPAFRMKQQWDETEEFRLFFDFQSQRTIEIASDTVELIAA